MTVLIVDDEVIVGTALARAFTKNGHTAVQASSGEEALKVWGQVNPQVVLLDVIMPGLNGPTVVEEIKKQDPKLTTGVKIIFMSAHSKIKNSASAEEFGGHAFIQKPFENVFEIVQRVEKWMAQK